MPIKRAAMKALRQTIKRTARNVKAKKNIKSLIRTSDKLISVKDSAAQDKVKAAIKALDKAAQKKILTKNTVARRKSKLMKRLNKAK